jgi:AcrR family transcriptional regulator
MAVPARRTQEERSAATRARLLDATVDCLLTRGYSGTTTTEIAQRAGVSRGAQLHHFPTKAQLVTRAVAWLFERRLDEFRAAFATLPEGADRAAAAVDLLWRMFTGRTFYAVLEVIVAARTDPALRASVTVVNRAFTESVERTFRELFPAPARPGPFFDLVPRFVFSLMDGMALARIVEPDDAGPARVIELLKALSPMLEHGPHAFQESKP